MTDVELAILHNDQKKLFKLRKLISQQDLFFACKNATKISVLGYILKVYSRLNIHPDIYDECLYQAIMVCNIKNINYLCEKKKANVNAIIEDGGLTNFIWMIKTSNHECVNKYLHKWNGKADGVSFAILNKFSEVEIESLWKKQKNITFQIKSFYKVCSIFNKCQQKDVDVYNLCYNFLIKHVHENLINPSMPSPSSLHNSIRMDNLCLFQLMFPKYTVITAVRCLQLACKNDSFKIMDFLIKKYQIQINYTTILESIRKRKFAWVFKENYWNQIHAKEYFYLALKFTNDVKIIEYLYDISKEDKQNVLLQNALFNKCNEIVSENPSINLELLIWIFSLLHEENHKRLSNSFFKICLSHGLLKPTTYWFETMLEDGELECCVSMLKKNIVYRKPVNLTEKNTLQYLLKQEVCQLLLNRCRLFSNLATMVCEYAENDFFIEED